MRGRIKSIIANFSFVILSNLTTLLISSLAVLLIPRIIGVEEYGYWQLYTFYISYVGFFHLGWPDGLYLKFGGQEYKKLDKGYFRNQFIAYNLYLGFLTILVLLWVNFAKFDVDRTFIFLMFAINMIVMNIKNYFILVLQATNQLKHSSLIAILDRIVYATLLVFLLLMGNQNYKIMILADIIGKIIGIIVALYICREIIFVKGIKLSFEAKEIFDNIRIGINLMLSNVASMLIIGVIRFGIENQWDITTFGKVSLTLSISNLLMVFINAIGIVIFPILKRADEEKLPIIYITARNILMIIMFLVLLAYYPLRLILDNWLPAYRESVIFMVLVFPMSVYEGKMSLLINTYMKALRMEKQIFRINVIVLILSCISTFILAVVLNNLELTVMSIVVLLATRSIIAEIVLSKAINVSVMKDIVIEAALTILFIITGWFINSWLSAIIYVSAYLIYIFWKKNTIISIKKLLKRA